MRTEEPRAVHLEDYTPPPYRIEEIALDFHLDPQATWVSSKMVVVRSSKDATPLVLNGEHLKLVSIAIDGRALDADAYTVGEETLIIARVPTRFTLEITTEISPANNTALEGLYVSKGIFCTQCEAEGFRRITYFVDRPDNLARYTTRIEADRATLPVLLSNGNLIDSGALDGGRHFAMWKDPFPKTPSSPCPTGASI
jgi:aminopeptidase N